MNNKLLIPIFTMMIFLFFSNCQTDLLEENSIQTTKFDAFPSGTRPNASSPYTINDCSWDECTIRYFVDNSSNELDQNDEMMVYRWAFDQWAVPTGLTFIQVDNSGTADIIIAFSENDGPGGELGFSFFPCSSYGDRAGNVILDINENWTLETRNGRDQPIDLYTVVLHEIGHALGMEHTSVEDALMWADYTGSRRFLHQDDLTGIGTIYDCSSSTNQPGNTPSGLVAHLPMNIHANDISGNDNNGILLGALSTSNRHGVNHKALHFKGYDPEDNPSRIEVLNSPALTFQSSFSFLMWTKVDNYTAMNYYGTLADHDTFQTLFSKNFSDGKIHAGIRYDGIQATIDFGDGDHLARTVLPDNFIGHWQHLAFTYDGSQIKIFLNGDLKAITNANIDLAATNASDLILGSHYYGEGEYNNDFYFWYPLRGALDEFRVYNSALTGEIIHDIMNQ